MFSLAEYSMAVFLATVNCWHKGRKGAELNKEITVKEKTIVNGVEIEYWKLVPNPKYNPYKEGELERILKEENDMIYEYLKKHFPDTDYAERFAREKNLKIN